MTLLVVLIVPLVSDRAFSYFPSTSILFISVLLCRTVCSAFFRLPAIASSGLFRHSRFPIFWDRLKLSACTTVQSCRCCSCLEFAYLHYCSASVELSLPGHCLLELLFSLCGAVSCLDIVCLNFCLASVRRWSCLELSDCTSVQPL